MDTREAIRQNAVEAVIFARKLEAWAEGSDPMDTYTAHELSVAARVVRIAGTRIERLTDQAIGEAVG